MTQCKKDLPNILTEFESEELLNQPNLRYPTGMRNYALMKLLLNSGIKLSEATNLVWTDLDLITGDLILRGDNILSSRTIILDGYTLETLIKWKNRQQINADDCRYVFTTLNGNKLKNVIVEDDPEQILEAVNDRGITRLIVEDIEPVEGVFLKETLNSAKSRIKTAVAYSATGRTDNGDIEITSCQAAEEMLIASLNRFQSLSDSQRVELINQREKLLKNGKIVESYRSIDLEQALDMLTTNTVQSETTKKYFKML